MDRNYANVQHGEFRETFDVPFTAAHDLLADAYYGPESPGTGRRAGGWRDGVEQTLLVGQTGYRLLAGVMERSTDGGATWAPLAESPDEVFRRLEQVLHHRYASAFGPALTLMGEKAQQVEAAGVDAMAVDAALTGAKGDPLALLQAVDVAAKAWDKGEAATIDVGGKAIAFEAVAVAEVPAEPIGGLEPVIEEKAAPSKTDLRVGLVALAKFVRDKTRAEAEAVTSADALAALQAQGWDLDLG